MRWTVRDECAEHSRRVGSCVADDVLLALSITLCASKEMCIGFTSLTIDFYFVTRGASGVRSVRTATSSGTITLYIHLQERQRLKVRFAFGLLPG